MCVIIYIVYCLLSVAASSFSTFCYQLLVGKGEAFPFGINFPAIILSYYLAKFAVALMAERHNSKFSDLCHMDVPSAVAIEKTYTNADHNS